MPPFFCFAERICNVFKNKIKLAIINKAISPIAINKFKSEPVLIKKFISLIKNDAIIAIENQNKYFLTITIPPFSKFYFIFILEYF